jgi:hypothetical protein
MAIFQRRSRITRDARSIEPGRSWWLDSTNDGVIRLASLKEVRKRTGKNLQPD